MHPVRNASRSLSLSSSVSSGLRPTPRPKISAALFESNGNIETQCSRNGARWALFDNVRHYSASIEKKSKGNFDWIKGGGWKLKDVADAEDGSSRSNSVMDVTDHRPFDGVSEAGLGKMSAVDLEAVKHDDHHVKSVHEFIKWMDIVNHAAEQLRSEEKTEVSGCVASSRSMVVGSDRVDIEEQKKILGRYFSEHEKTGGAERVHKEPNGSRLFRT